jgi:hypothetical protein
MDIPAKLVIRKNDFTVGSRLPIHQTINPTVKKVMPNRVIMNTKTALKGRLANTSASCSVPFRSILKDAGDFNPTPSLSHLACARLIIAVPSIAFNLSPGNIPADSAPLPALTWEIQTSPPNCSVSIPYSVRLITVIVPNTAIEANTSMNKPRLKFNLTFDINLLETIIG